MTRWRPAGPSGSAVVGGRLTARHLAATWVVLVGLLGGLLFVAARAASPLDDPDPARQRPRFLDAAGHLTPAPRVTAAVPSSGRRAVIFFVRPQLVAPLCRTIAGDRGLRTRADLVVVSSAPQESCGGVTVVTDATGGLAAGFGMRRPRDRGAPVGYAVVDRTGRIRYATLDPSMVSGLREVETVVEATP